MTFKMTNLIIQDAIKFRALLFLYLLVRQKTQSSQPRARAIPLLRFLATNTKAGGTGGAEKRAGRLAGLGLVTPHRR
jgi:hypothetical protein